MDLLRTDRTYKTRANAVKALAKKVNIDEVRYFIAVNEAGRFAPVVMLDERKPWITGLIHEGITVAR